MPHPHQVLVVDAAIGGPGRIGHARDAHRCLEFGVFLGKGRKETDESLTNVRVQRPELTRHIRQSRQTVGVQILVLQFSTRNFIFSIRNIAMLILHDNIISPCHALTRILSMLYCMVLITTSIKRPPKDISLMDLSVYQLTPFSIYNARTTQSLQISKLYNTSLVHLQFHALAC